MTKDEIRAHIKTAPATEFEADHIDYYLHVTDQGQIVQGASKADFSAVVTLTPEDYGLTLEEYDRTDVKDAIYAHEEDGDPLFERIIDELYTQAAAHLAEATRDKLSALVPLDMPDDLRRHIAETYDAAAWEPITGTIWEHGTPWSLSLFEQDIEYDGHTWRCHIVQRTVFDADDPAAVDFAEDILSNAFQI